jgi:hypothetical protein
MDDPRLDRLMLERDGDEDTLREVGVADLDMLDELVRDDREGAGL